MDNWSVIAWTFSSEVDHFQAYCGVSKWRTSNPKITLPFKVLEGIHIRKCEMAERQGFEPWRRFLAYTLSRRAPSTTRPPLRIFYGKRRMRFCFVRRFFRPLKSAAPSTSRACFLYPYLQQILRKKTSPSGAHYSHVERLCKRQFQFISTQNASSTASMSKSAKLLPTLYVIMNSCQKPALDCWSPIPGELTV